MDQSTIAQDNLCSRCGGKLRFDPEAQALMCTSCKEEAEPAFQETDAVDASFNCPNCGAELTLITGSRQAKCDFCDGTFSILSEGDDCELTGEIPGDHKYVIPFTVDEETYRKGMISWLANEKLTPEDAFSKIAIIKTEGKYIPYYYCIANFKGSYTASVGYDRVETYIEYETRTDSKGKTTTVPVTRTRIVTDWHPFQSQISGSSTNLCEASRAIKDMQAKVHKANPEKMLKGIKNSSHGLFENLDIQIDRKDPYDTKYTTGYTIIGCDDPVSIAYDKTKINADIHRLIKQTAPGDRIRGIRFSGNIIPDYFLVYRPYWVTVYSYGDKICFNTCEGTNPSKHYGTRPIDKAKKERLRKKRNWLLISLGVFALSFIGIYAIYPEGVLLTLLALGVVLSFVSGAAAAIAYIYSYVVLVRKGRQANIEESKRYIANPSAIFGRKSAKADPTK